MADPVLEYGLILNEDNAEPLGRSWAGLVLIVHGYNLKIVGEPSWTGSMQQAIIRRLRSNGRTGRIVVSEKKHDLKANFHWLDGTKADRSDSDIVLRLDWSSIANHLVSGVSTRDVALRVLPLLLAGDTGLPDLRKIPIHLIGHSRGASLVCELARQLGKNEIFIDQVTLLDPHPLTGEDPQNPAQDPVIDMPVQRYDNIGFMDNYWQGIGYPQGKHIAGAFNRSWNKLPGGYHRTIHAPSGDHMNIILLYHGTITGKVPVINGEAEFGEKEWGKLFRPEEENGKKIGYVFSNAVRPELRPVNK